MKDPASRPRRPPCDPPPRSWPRGPSGACGARRRRRRSAVIAGEVERLHVDRADRLVGTAVLEVARGYGRRLAVFLERVVLAGGSGEQLPAVRFGSGG